MGRYIARSLTALCAMLCAAALGGCGESGSGASSEASSEAGSEASGEASSEAGSDTELTQEYVCSEFGIPEAEFEGVDFARFVDYYGLSYENIHNESVEYLLREYKKNNGEPAFYDYRYMYDADRDAVLTREDQNSVSVVFLAQAEDDLNSYWIFDFEKGIKIVGAGAVQVIPGDNVTAALTQEHREQVLGLFEKYDVYAWYEGREELNSGEEQSLEEQSLEEQSSDRWYLSVRLQDGTVASVSGSAEDSSADFAGLLSEITDIGE